MSLRDVGLTKSTTKVKSYELDVMAESILSSLMCFFGLAEQKFPACF